MTNAVRHLFDETLNEPHNSSQNEGQGDLAFYFCHFYPQSGSFIHRLMLMMIATVRM